MSANAPVDPRLVVESLLGEAAEQLDVLVDHGYRGVARVIAGGRTLVAKWDRREGWIPREVEARQRAGVIGAPVARALRQQSSPVPCALFPWVEGIPLRGSPPGDAWRDAGRVLRLVHRAEPVAHHDTPWADLMHEWLQAALGYLVEERGLDPLDAEAASDAAMMLRPVLEAQPLVAIHGDCQSDHFLLDPSSERVVGVLDWAEAQAGDPAFDFAVLSLIDADVLADILDGYGASASLREHVRLTQPLYRVIRRAAGVRWLDEHGFARSEWPLDEVRALARW